MTDPTTDLTVATAPVVSPAVTTAAVTPAVTPGVTSDVASTVQTSTVTPAVIPAAGVTAPSADPLFGGWQVDPDKVTDFAGGVAQVRSDLDTVFSQVNQLTSPAYQPQLGTSECGQALTAKFVDRLSGTDGLLSNLNAVLSHLDQFVTNAQQTAAQYQEADSSSADTLRTT